MMMIVIEEIAVDRAHEKGKGIAEVKEIEEKEVVVEIEREGVQDQGIVEVIGEIEMKDHKKIVIRTEGLTPIKGTETARVVEEEEKTSCQ